MSFPTLAATALAHFFGPNTFPAQSLNARLFRCCCSISEFVSGTETDEVLGSSEELLATFRLN
jgi:hypothetical protein